MEWSNVNSHELHLQSAEKMMEQEFLRNLIPK